MNKTDLITVHPNSNGYTVVQKDHDGKIQRIIGKHFPKAQIENVNKNSANH